MCALAPAALDLGDLLFAKLALILPEGHVKSVTLFDVLIFAPGAGPYLELA